MKKLKRILLFALMLVIVFPFSMILTGCSHGSIEVRFYDPDYIQICADKYEFKQYEDRWGVLIDSIVPPSSISQLDGYEVSGWKRFDPLTYEIYDYDKIWKFDGTHGLYQFSLDQCFVAVCEIKDSGWVYYGNGEYANAFEWSSGKYASISLNLQKGSNTIRFDKTNETETLRRLKIFENGGNGHYIKNIEIRDANGCRVGLSTNNFNENIYFDNLNSIDATSFIIHIETTQAFEAGVMIGADLD